MPALSDLSTSQRCEFEAIMQMIRDKKRFVSPFEIGRYVGLYREHGERALYFAVE